MRQEIIEKIKKIQSESELKEFVKDNIQELSELNLEKVQGGTVDTKTLEDLVKNQQQKQEDREIMELLLELFKDLTKTTDQSEIKIG